MMQSFFLRYRAIFILSTYVESIYILDLLKQVIDVKEIKFSFLDFLINLHQFCVQSTWDRKQVIKIKECMYFDQTSVL